MKCTEVMAENIPAGWERMALPVCPRCGQKMIRDGFTGNGWLNYRHPKKEGPLDMGRAFWEKIEEENDGK